MLLDVGICADRNGTLVFVSDRVQSDLTTTTLSLYYLSAPSARICWQSVSPSLQLPERHTRPGLLSVRSHAHLVSVSASFCSDRVKRSCGQRHGRQREEHTLSWKDAAGSTVPWPARFPRTQRR